MLDGSEAGGLGGRLVQGAAIPDLPGIGEVDNMETTARYRRRLELVDKMSGDRTEHGPYPFFAMLGRMLERRFTFVSEQRKFQESNGMERPSVRSSHDIISTLGRRWEPNGMERLSLSNDGSNLQSYLFWLQNGDKDEQDACSTIRKTFEEVMEQQNLSFVVSVAEKDGYPFTSRSDRPKGEIYPDKTIVRFVKNTGQEQRLLGFMSVGAGVRETLFLLAMCFGRQDGVVLLDEPAANLHPTQIRRLMGRIMSAGEQDAKSGQIAVVTHSPSLASLEMLSRANEIVRVSRREHSIVAQPSREDMKWIKENLSTFHLLKSDVFFARRVVLVEGYSDRIILEAILDQGSVLGGDITVVDVGGKKSFKKFRRLLDIFEIPHVILADDDAGGEFVPDEVVKVDTKAITRAEGATDKTVCLLEKDLEGLLSELDPELYKEIKREYQTKIKRAYRFAELFFAGDPSVKGADLPRFLRKWVAKDRERQ